MFNKFYSKLIKINKFTKNYLFLHKMKKVLTICILLLNPFITLSEKSSYDYSSYTASSKDTNLSGQIISSTTSGASAVYITSSGITISNSQINKSGDVASGSTEDSEFYGVNAAILVNGG